MVRNSMLAGLFGLLCCGVVGQLGCGNGGSCGQPGKDKTFTKMRGPNVGGDEGEDVCGACTADEKGKAACYGNILVQCSNDGAPHKVDCTQGRVGVSKCSETDTVADCM